ncbi:EAL domain-containing protein [Photobacterium frigidiphilum]|uniref:sensor domain-containing protein n=1 Tax=Photobacterium frigidiphilum TaxID=264736 RepID=UPI003D0C3F3B
MKKALLRFIVLLLPLLSITTVATLYIYHEDANQLELRIQEKELTKHQSVLHITRLHFTPIIDDLRYLTAKSQELAFTPGLTQNQKDRMLETFIRIMKTRNHYDQIRLINANGMEVLRVNKKGDDIFLVPDDELQDKSKRSYIQKGLQVPVGSFYTSQFDLNVENGKVEVPNKPMLRFVSHFKSNGENWLITLNYLGENFLNQIQQDYNWSQGGGNWLVNNHGQWLLGPNKDSAWQFDLSNAIDTKDFFQQYPNIWNEIGKKKHGQIRAGDYLYTYSRFFSSKELSSTKLFILPFEGADLPWTIISRVNMASLVTELSFSQQRIIKFATFGILIMALVSGCIVLAWHLYQQLIHEKKLKQEIDDNAQRYASVLKNAPDGLMTLNNNLEITALNHSAERVFNITDTTEAIGKNIYDIVHDKKAKNILNQLIYQVQLAMADGNNTPIKASIQLPNHTSIKYVALIASETVFSSTSEILLHISDVTDWIERELKLKSLSHAVEQSDNTVLITDKNGIIEYVNHSFEAFTGITSAEALGRDSRTLMKGSNETTSEIKHIRQQLKAGRTINRIITRKKSDNTVCYEDETISPIRNDTGKISHYISTGKDITERVLFESKLHKLAHYDLLTELPNRLLLLQYIEQAITNAEEMKTSVVVFNIDLDFFKKINDSLGHDVGDKVLITIAKRITRSLRDEDVLARLGGDEFAILIQSDTSSQSIATLAERIINNICASLSIEEKSLSITASMGIAVYPENSVDSDALLKNSDIALYRAKDQGRNRYCFFTPKMGIESVQRLQLESDLRKSLGTDQYTFFYQPKVNAKTHKVCGIEALLRWKNEEGQIQSPLGIIPILENSGLIVNVGETLINQACEQLAIWQSNGLDLHFALNISARQLLHSDIVDTVYKAVTMSGCNPHYLELEITESVVMADVKLAFDKLIKLEALGVKIAIDDFGTGYSSLAYLSRFPIHILKVDREFVQDLPMNKDSVTITRSIIELAHNLSMLVVAEGVENEDQIKFLTNIGVEEFQGYYFGKPMPIDEFELKFITDSRNTESILDET